MICACVVPHPPAIFPEIGRGVGEKLEKTVTAYREIARRTAEARPDTVIIISPHATAYTDYFHISPGGGASGAMEAFGCPNVKISVEYDKPLALKITELANDAGFPAGTAYERDAALDHGALIPLRFIGERCPGVRVLRIGLSDLSALKHYELGRLVERAVGLLGRRAVLIASGDLSHKLSEDGPYGFDPAGAEFDRRVCESLARGDFLSILDIGAPLSRSAAECGLRAIWMLAGALDRRAVESELLSYEAPFGVGYAAAYFRDAGYEPSRAAGEQYARLLEKRRGDMISREDEYQALARLCVETYVKTGRRAALPGSMSEDLTSRRAGAFVSLRLRGELRGCVGTVAASQKRLCDEIAENAVSAAAHDARFAPVTRDELTELEYSVDILGEPEPVTSTGQLDPVVYGVIVTGYNRRGLLLPDLEGVDTVDAQLDIARKKAGISPKEHVKISRFTVERHTC